MSRSQRLAYYAALPRSSQPLFDDDYDDTICLTDPVTGLFDQRHLKAMTDYSQFHNLNRLAEEICSGNIVDMRIK